MFLIEIILSFLILIDIFWLVVFFVCFISERGLFVNNINDYKNKVGKKVEFICEIILVPTFLQKNNLDIWSLWRLKKENVKFSQTAEIW